MGADVLAVAYQEAANDILKQVHDETTILDVFFRAQQQNPFSYQQVLSMAHDEKPIFDSQFDDQESFCFIAKKMAEEPLPSDFSGKLES